MIPAEWTDFALPSQVGPAAPTALTLGSLQGLRHARAVVDALLSRTSTAVKNETAVKESPIAGKTSESFRSSPRRKRSVGNIARRNQERGDRASRTPAC